MAGDVPNELPTFEKVPTVEESIAQFHGKQDSSPFQPTVEQSIAQSFNQQPAPSAFQLQLTIPKNGTVATIAPTDPGAWYERWWDASLAPWRNALVDQVAPGVTRTYAQAIAESKASDDALAALVAQNIVTGNSNDKLRQSAKPTVAPTRFDGNVHAAYMTPRRYEKLADDENAQIAADNAKLPPERQLAKLTKPTAPTSFVQELRRRGQHESQFQKQIPDAMTKSISDFRAKALAKTKEPEVDWGWEPDPRHKFVGSRLKEIHQSLRSKNQAGMTMYDQRKVLQKQADDEKNKKRDEAQSKLSALKAQIDALESEEKPLLAERDAALADGTVSAYANNGRINTLTGTALAEVRGRLGYTEARLDDAFTKLCGAEASSGPASKAVPARESVPQSVISYDGTLSIGAGFAPSTGGDGVLRNIAKPEAVLAADPKIASALHEMHTYLKKCGIYIGTTDVPNKHILDIRVVHIEGSRGYVIANELEAYTGLFKGMGQSHDFLIGAAYQYIRHSKVLQQALFSLCDSDKLMEQSSLDAAPMLDTMSAMCAITFYRLHMNPSYSITYSPHIKSRALYVFLTHLSHWGPGTYVTDGILRWIFARRLVPCTVGFGDSKTVAAAKVEMKESQGAEDSAAEESVDNVTTFSYAPSIVNDITIAKCVMAFSILTTRNSTVQLAEYWGQFIEDLAELDNYEPGEIWDPPNPQKSSERKPRFAFETLDSYMKRTKLKCDDATMTSIADADDASADHLAVSTGRTTTAYVLAPVRVRDWKEASAFVDGYNFQTHLAPFRRAVPADSGVRKL